MSPTLHSETGILTINAGSSSIKFAFFRGGQALVRAVSGQVERIGLPGTELILTQTVRA
jgi:acetate kinase